MRDTSIEDVRVLSCLSLSQLWGELNATGVKHFYFLHAVQTFLVSSEEMNFGCCPMINVHTNAWICYLLAEKDYMEGAKVQKINI